MKAFKKAAALAVAGSAFACASGALADTIAAAPAVDFLSPFVNAVVGVVVPVVIAWGIVELRKLTGITLSAANADLLQNAAATEAGALVAGAEDNLAGSVITVSSPKIAQAAMNIEKSLPGVAKALGVTPDGVAKLVVGEVGKLQAAQSPPAAAPAAK